MSDSSQQGDAQPTMPKPPSRPAARPPTGAAPGPGAPPPHPGISARAPGVRSNIEAPSEPTTLRTGDTVGGAFVVQRYLGSSGGAISYLCTENATGDSVVIKVLSRPYPGDQAYDEYRKRIQVANSLRHRNLTGILGMGKTGANEIGRASCRERV